jgi:hypothetical protein
MSYPPNSPTIITRGPQHGINIPRSHPSPTIAGVSAVAGAANAMTVKCSHNWCPNDVTVTLFGNHESVWVKARCKECEMPVAVPVWGRKGKEEESSEEWVEEGQGDEVRGERW